MCPGLKWPLSAWTLDSILLSGAAIIVLSLAASFAFVLGKAYIQVRNFDGPPCHWIKGHINQATFDGQGLKFHLECTELYKTAYRVWFGPIRSAVVLCHPKTIKPILATTFKEKTVCHLLSSFLGIGLGLQKGERWKSTRRLLTPAFNFPKVEPYLKTFQESVNILLTNWSLSTNSEVELFHDIGLLTLDIILKCAFSYKRTLAYGKFPLKVSCRYPTSEPVIGSLSNDVDDAEDGAEDSADTPDSFMTAIHENTRAIMDRFLNPFYHSDFIYNLTPSGRKFNTNSEIVAQKADEIIKKRRQALIDQPKEEALRKEEHFDFLDILLEARRENGQALTDEEIRAEVRTFMFAGLDTVTSAICWILYCLAQYPEHQQKCRDEVDSILEQENGLQKTDLSNVPYLKLCINEAMRLYSPVPIICRSSDKHYDLQGRTLPPGTFLYVNIFALHRNPDIWENPEVFDPLRFSEENSKERPPHAFMPFSAGVRNCIGQIFAMAEIKTTLAMILHRFELTVSEDKMVSMEDLLTVLVLRSKTGVRVNITPRNHNHISQPVPG